MIRSLVVVMCLVGSAFADKPAPPRTDSIVARVLTVKVESGTTIVTVSMGSDAGVDKELACAFVGPTGLPSTGSCIVVRVDKRSTVVKTSLTADEVKKSPTVKLGPIVR